MATTMRFLGVFLRLQVKLIHNHECFVFGQNYIIDCLIDLVLYCDFKFSLIHLVIYLFAFYDLY